jgi:hypothetical protein
MVGFRIYHHHYFLEVDLLVEYFLNLHVKFETTLDPPPPPEPPDPVHH